MARRKTENKTGIPRLPGLSAHDAWVCFVCVKCGKPSFVKAGGHLLAAQAALKDAEWNCQNCGFLHRDGAELPFAHWPPEARQKGREAGNRFWRAFFRASASNPESYWKTCNACGRLLPFADFARHAGWGPLEKQMECRSCKAAINALLNPKRTAQQHFEGALNRRVANLLLEGEERSVDIATLFRRFNGKCFKTGKPLQKNERESWAVDHILPARYLYPLTETNAALLSREANEEKRDHWPSEFYTSSELVRLAKITGADLSLLASPVPVLNPRIDVNACVERALAVRERSNLEKRVMQLKTFFQKNDLVSRLSPENRRMLGLHSEP